MFHGFIIPGIIPSMRKYKTVKKEVLEIARITCNKCGKSCGALPGEGDAHYGLFTSVRGHYYSPALEDGVEYKFDICEPCLLKLFKTFKITIVKEHYPLNEG